MSEGDVIEQKIVAEAPVEAAMPVDTGEDEQFEEGRKKEEEYGEGDNENKYGSDGDIGDISEEAKFLFHEYDIDKNGTLSSFELERALIELGFSPSKGEVKLIQKRYDENNDGEIDFDEFMKIVRDIQVLEEEEISEKNLIAAFKVFDESGNGFISVDELKKALTENDDYDYDSDEIKEIMEDVDYDEDGQLNYEEFVEFMFTGKENKEGEESENEEESEND